MKFNIVGNPPYSGKGEKLYLRIMSACEKFAETAVWIIPTDFIDNPKIQDNINYKHVKIINQRFYDFSRIKTVVGDAGFQNASFFSDIGIFVFKKKAKDILDIRWEKFSDPVKYKKIADIVDRYLVSAKTISSEQGKENNYYIRLSEIRGHRRCWDWPTLLSKERYTPIQNVPKSSLKIKNQYIGFNTEIECQNFIDWCNTDLAMFLNFLYKFNQHTKYECIPVFDFTKAISESEIYAIMGLTEYKDFIIQEMRPYGYKTVNVQQTLK